MKVRDLVKSATIELINPNIQTLGIIIKDSIYTPGRIMHVHWIIRSETYTSIFKQVKDILDLKKVES